MVVHGVVSVVHGVVLLAHAWCGVVGACMVWCCWRMHGVVLVAHARSPMDDASPAAAAGVMPVPDTSRPPNLCGTGPTKPELLAS